MANLSIRKVDAFVHQQLQERAAAHGISMEEEARRILFEAVVPQKSIAAIFKQHFGEMRGVDIPVVKRRAHLPLRFKS